MIAEFPGVAESVRAARQMIRQAIGEAPAAEAAALVVSELATNAIAYTRSGLPGGTFTASVTGAPGGGVVVSVTDQGPRAAGQAPHVVTGGQPAQEHGRGLAIVAAVAAGWGTELTPAGRVTWCVLRGETPAPAAHTGVHPHGCSRARARARGGALA
jgi:anti-sigma regulatory factor (Ser/Thr protein kinase)